MYLNSMLKSIFTRTGVSICGMALVVASSGLVVSAVRANGGGDADPTAGPQLPNVIAVRVHADWCGACAKLNPVFPDLKKRSSEMPVLFMTFDVTNGGTSRQAEYLAGVAGLGEIWQSLRKKVGNIVLIDTKSKRTVSTVAATDGLESIENALRRAVDSALAAG